MRPETGLITKFVRKDCHTGGPEEEMVPDGNSIPVYHQTNDNAAQTGSPATSGYPSFERRSKQTCQSGALYQVEETPNNRDERAEFHPSAACPHTHDSRTRALRLIRTQFLIVKRAWIRNQGGGLTKTLQISIESSQGCGWKERPILGRRQKEKTARPYHEEMKLFLTH